MLRRLALMLVLLAAGTAHAAIQVRDDRNATVSFAAPPQRIVSLLPSLTEFVCALDACSRLVGVDDYSNFPAAVRKVPHVGGLEDARIEAIVALRPDLVLTPTSSRALDRLQALGLKVLALEPRTFADVQRVLGILGPVLGTADAAVTWRRIEQDLAAVARSLPPALRGTRVYFEVSGAPYAAGESSFIGELLTRIGAANVVPAALGPFPKLNPEFVVRADPEVIFVEQGEAAGLPQRPGWRAIRAVREQRICAYGSAQADVLARPGPRMAQAAQLMVQCLQGRFPEAAR
ncbi:helical backbone metal receptor [Ramlibacter sp. XY19]|uniref:ABC transporter substrate-binding protein n=1 Tax=Ramlibacter paludis TaxID=2908000 RepID=UPI0023DCE99A|nr:helical backbone metal receptor [Ramlibacter paludis]MCG2592701.1 helical backbone metal receptor [Ramlibacter paludis]